MTNTTAALMNSLGETLFVVTLWSTHGLDYVTANVWAADRQVAFDEALDVYPFTSRVVDIREGTIDDLD